MALGNIGSSRRQTLWAQVQTAFSTFPNAAGTWTNTGAIKQRYDEFNPQAANPVNSPTYYTGKSSPLIGTRGRQGGNWTLGMPLIPSGTAGTAPDADPILQAVFGGTPTIVASTSVTYNLVDTVAPLGLLWYNGNTNESNPTHYYILGACPTQATFILNQNFLSFRAQGFGYGRGDSTSFSSYTSGDAGLKGGLTVYPAEPGSVTQNGNVIPGYGNGATATFDGNATLELRGQVELTVNTGLEGLGDTFANAYQVAAGRGLRTVSMQRIQCVDSDGTTIANLKAKAFNKTPISIALQVNGAAGSIATFTLNNVQLGGSEISVNGAFLDIIWNDNQAHASSTSVTDDAVLSFT
jgi:hypothetical protein